MRDPYDILGVANTSSADDIKKAYRKLARDHHPDRHQGDPKAADRFKDISAAYGLLSDPEKRRRFDAGELDAQGNEKRRPRGWGNGWGPGGAAGQRSPFEDLFRHHRAKAGFGGAQRTPIKGANVSYTLKVKFLDAARGAKRQVSMTNGKHFYVTVPAGTQDGQVLRLKGQGMSGTGGAPAGDALVEVQMTADDTFTRDANDIMVEVPITLDEAILGGKIDVPTIDGTVTMAIPAGANSGTKMRLKGRGIAPPKGDPGDQYVSLTVVLPEKPDTELTDFVRGWAEKNPYRVRKRPADAS